LEITRCSGLDSAANARSPGGCGVFPLRVRKPKPRSVLLGLWLSPRAARTARTAARSRRRGRRECSAGWHRGARGHGASSGPCPLSDLSNRQSSWGDVLPRVWRAALSRRRAWTPGEEQNDGCRRWRHSWRGAKPAGCSGRTTPKDRATAARRCLRTATPCCCASAFRNARWCGRSTWHVDASDDQASRRWSSRRRSAPSRQRAPTRRARRSSRSRDQSLSRLRRSQRPFRSLLSAVRRPARWRLGGTTALSPSGAGTPRNCRAHA